jgi:hypothetical protein
MLELLSSIPTVNDFAYTVFTEDGNDVDFDTLDAKLARALRNIMPAHFTNAIQARKQQAMRAGRLSRGRQISWLIDQHFKISAADGAIYDIEHLFSVSIKAGGLSQFLNTWVTVYAGLRIAPADQFLGALTLKQTRQCEALVLDGAQYDRLPIGYQDRSYEYLLRCCRRVLARNRLEWTRNELARLISGGRGALTVGDAGGKGHGKQAKPQADSKAAGDSRQPRGRSTSKQARARSGEVCRQHLVGKCDAGVFVPQAAQSAAQIHLDEGWLQARQRLPVPAPPTIRGC